MQSQDPSMTCSIDNCGLAESSLRTAGEAFERPQTYERNALLEILPPSAPPPLPPIPPNSPSRWREDHTYSRHFKDQSLKTSKNERLPVNPV